MQTVAALKKKINNAQDLESVVKTMKSIAAVNIRFYENATDALRSYVRTIELGMQAALGSDFGRQLLRKPRPQRHANAVVVVGSAQGMCGQFNDKIADFAADRIHDLQRGGGRTNVIAMGERLADKLRRHSIDISSTVVLPSSLEGIKDSVNQLLFRIQEWRTTEETDNFVLLYNRYLSGADYEPIRKGLMPLDHEWLHSLARAEWAGPSLPLYSIASPHLVASLVQHYFFAALHTAVTESLTGENASRLSSMEAAEKNIGEHLEELNKQFHQRRQSAITAELLDIISGYETLTGGSV